jgi:hypothetical protein
MAKILMTKTFETIVFHCYLSQAQNDFTGFETSVKSILSKTQQSSNLPDPDELANDIIENLEAGIESFKEIMMALNGR